jgi:hypothetical protein
MIKNCYRNVENTYIINVAIIKNKMMQSNGGCSRKKRKRKRNNILIPNPSLSDYLSRS